MKRAAIIGAQWGDEGKGKVVNFYAPRFGWVIRFSGGANAGHTIHWRGKQYVNHLLPSVVPGSGTQGFLGAGMVIDLEQLLREIDTLEADYSGFGRQIYVDPEAFLVLPWHKEEDAILEELRRSPLGTTRRGIGPAYADKISRQGLRVIDLFDEEILKDRLTELGHFKRNLYGEKLSQRPSEVQEALLNTLNSLLERGVRFTSAIELKAEWSEAALLYEGAQGILLDIDAGTYPFVTSASTSAHGISVTGTTPGDLDEVLGVVKAYTTRVGEGPFPTELQGETAEELRNRGNEFGATTGRPRRVGWLDLPALRYAAHRSRLTKIILTKADVLCGFDQVKICVAYHQGGGEQSLPRHSRDIFSARPVYETLPGWKTLDDENFRHYCDFIQNTTSLPIAMVSHGPGTDEIMEWN